MRSDNDPGSRRAYLTAGLVAAALLCVALHRAMSRGPEFERIEVAERSLAMLEEAPAPLATVPMQDRASVARQVTRDALHSIVGSVRTIDGVAIAGARIVAMSASGREDATSDADGAFALQGSEWPQRIRCHPPVGWRAVQRETVVDERPEQALSFEVEPVPMLPVSGRIVDRRTGDPVPRYQLTVAGHMADDCLSSGGGVASSYDFFLLGELVETDSNGFFETKCSFHSEGREVKIWAHDDLRTSKAGSLIYSYHSVPDAVRSTFSIDVGPTCRLLIRGPQLQPSSLRALLHPVDTPFKEVPYWSSMASVRADDGWTWVRFQDRLETPETEFQVLVISEGPDRLIGVSPRLQATQGSPLAGVTLQRAAGLTVSVAKSERRQDVAVLVLDAPESMPAIPRRFYMIHGGAVAFGPVVPGVRLLRVLEGEREIYRQTLYLEEGRAHRIELPPDLGLR